MLCETGKRYFIHELYSFLYQLGSILGLFSMETSFSIVFIIVCMDLFNELSRLVQCSDMLPFVRSLLPKKVSQPALVLESVSLTLIFFFFFFKSSLNYRT